MRGTLYPFRSTHFRCMETRYDYVQNREALYGIPLTKGKVYPIEWRSDRCFHFLDDTGVEREWGDYWGIDDASFSYCLERVLE